MVSGGSCQREKVIKPKATVNINININMNKLSVKGNDTNPNTYINSAYSNTNPDALLNLKTNSLRIFHQNIRGLVRKSNELLFSLTPDPPQVLCLSEHHLRIEELTSLNLDSYTLGAQFCRQKFKQGGFCIYISKDFQFSFINLDQFINEKDLKICALKLHLPLNSHNHMYLKVSVG